MGCSCSTAVQAVEPQACQKSAGEHEAPIKSQEAALKPKVASLPVAYGEEAVTPPGAVGTPLGAQTLPCTPSSCPSAIDLSPAAARPPRDASASASSTAVVDADGAAAGTGAATPVATSSAVAPAPVEAQAAEAQAPEPTAAAAVDMAGSKEAAPAAAAATAGEVAAATQSPTEAAGAPEPPRKPARQLSWQAVDCGAQEMAEAFKAYVARVPSEITRTLNCSWEHLAAAQAGLAAATGSAAAEASAAPAAAAPAEALQWFWLMDAGEAPVEGGQAQNAVGLAVFRVARGAASSHGQIFHLSMAVPDWKEELLPALRALRQEMMGLLSVAALRVTLWYAEYEDKYRLDRDVEAAFSQAGFRWFQLTNTADGKRGQIKQAKRNPELGDPEAQEEIFDLRLCTCLFLPKGGAGGGAAAEAGAAEGALTEGARAPSNGLVMAECLRRHSLQQPDGGAPLLPAEVPVEDGDAEAEASGGAEQAAKKPRLEGGAVAGELFRKLTRRGTIDVVRSADAEGAEDCESFARNCLAGLGAEGGAEGIAVRQLLQQETRALCGGLNLAISWKESRVLPGDHSRVLVPVQATGGRCSGSGIGGGGAESQVVYLATQDDDIFISVWQLSPGESADMAQDELYRRCQSTLKECPPTEVGDARAVCEVAMPRFRLRALAAAELPRSVPQAQAFGAPKEIIAAQLAVRPPPKGALRLPGDDVAPERVLQLDRPFVLCAWHSRFEDLEVPLLALVVRPEDWEASHRAG